MMTLQLVLGLAAYAVDGDDDGFPLPADCDDANPRTFPGATELCDGVRNDCDDSGWTDDDQLVSWFDADGTTGDFTGRFVDPGSDVWIWRSDTSSGSGRLAFCPGVYRRGVVFLGFDDGDVSVEGIAGSAATTFLFSEHGVLEMDRSTGDIAFTGLTLIGGDVLVVSGPGVASLTVSDVVLVGKPSLVGDDRPHARLFTSTRADTLTVSGLRLLGGADVALYLGSEIPSNVLLTDITGTDGGPVFLYAEGVPANLHVTARNIHLSGRSTSLTVANATADLEDVTITTTSDFALGLSNTVATAERLHATCGKGPDSCLELADASSLDLYDATIATQGRSGVHAYAGSHLDLVDSSVTMPGRGTGVQVSAGAQARLFGSTVTGASTGLLADGASIDLVDAIVAGNAVGGLVTNGAALGCTRATEPLAGFTDNGAVGVQLDDGVAPNTLVSNDCEWGVGPDDNGADVHLEGRAPPNDVYLYDGPATFSCANSDGGGQCGP